jgi:hypothetical protein
MAPNGMGKIFRRMEMYREMYIIRLEYWLNGCIHLSKSIKICLRSVHFTACNLTLIIKRILNFHNILKRKTVFVHT